MAQTPHSEGAYATEALANPLRVHDSYPREAGTMDISRQEATFAGFLRFSARMAVLAVVLLILIALSEAFQLAGAGANLTMALYDHDWLALRCSVVVFLQWWQIFMLPRRASYTSPNAAYL